MHGIALCWYAVCRVALCRVGLCGATRRGVAWCGVVLCCARVAWHGVALRCAVPSCVALHRVVWCGVAFRCVLLRRARVSLRCGVVRCECSAFGCVTHHSHRRCARARICLRGRALPAARSQQSAMGAVGRWVVVCIKHLATQLVSARTQPGKAATPRSSTDEGCMMWRHEIAGSRAAPCGTAVAVSGTDGHH